MTIATLRRFIVLAVLALIAFGYLGIMGATAWRAAASSQNAGEVRGVNRELSDRVSRLESERTALETGRRSRAIIAEDGPAAARLLETAIASSFADADGEMLSLQGRTADTSIQVSALWRGSEGEFRSALTRLAAQQPGLAFERLRLRRITDRPGNLLEAEIIAIQPFEVMP